MESLLTKLNQCLSCTNRSILLMIDNAGCHPEDLMSKFSNIKVFFLPANTTSKLQPTASRSWHHSELQSSLSQPFLEVRPV